MTLLYDVSRCMGRHETAQCEFPPLYLECRNCRRRTEPGHPTHQSQMAPPQFVDGKCPERIEPEDRIAPEETT